MREQEVSCAALGCREPRQDAGAEFCRNHQRQIQIFERWLQGVDEQRWPGAPSFDSERSFWSVRQPPA